MEPSRYEQPSHTVSTSARHAGKKGKNLANDWKNDGRFIPLVVQSEIMSLRSQITSLVRFQKSARLPGKFYVIKVKLKVNLMKQY